MSQASPGAAEQDQAAPLSHPVPGVRESFLDRGCVWLCGAAITVMILLTTGEIIARQVFHVSFGISDEVGGYLVVALTFLSLPACQSNGVFHSAELVQARLGTRSRKLSRIAFDLMALLVAGVLLWQTGRFFLQSLASGERSNTSAANSCSGERSNTEWAVPLWLPRASMPIGSLVLCITLVGVVRARIKDYRSAPQDEREDMAR